MNDASWGFTGDSTFHHSHPATHRSSLAGAAANCLGPPHSVRLRPESMLGMALAIDRQHETSIKSMQYGGDGGIRTLDTPFSV